MTNNTAPQQDVDMSHTLMDLAARFPDVAACLHWFGAFATPYMNEATRGPLELKINHTRQVVLVAERIVDALDLSLAGMYLPTTRPFLSETEIRRAALLAALLHDVGRFPQLARWQTLRDADSENHGRLGGRIVRESQVLNDEERAVRTAVVAAVSLHNRYRLPERMNATVRLVTDIVRDADKVDILRIFSAEMGKAQPSGVVVLHVEHQPEAWSPHIAEMVLRDQLPNYVDLRFVNDFIMLLCAWPQSLRFTTGLHIITQQGYIEQLLEKLPDDPQLNSVRQHIRAFMQRALA